MPAMIIDGIRVANTILAQTHQRAFEMVTALGRRPCLATVLVGEDPGLAYVRPAEDESLPHRRTGLSQPLPVGVDDDE